MALAQFIDLYHGQGDVNFATMKKQNVDLVLAKVSEGGFADPKWPQYARDARAAGLHIGGYFYVQTSSSLTPEAQADFFVDHLLAAGGPLALHMYDLEWSGANGVPRGAPLVDYYRRAISHADGRLGARGSIYTVKSFWHDYTGDSAAFVDHDLIFATARGGTPPVNADLWEAWFNANGGVMAPKYWPVGPWTRWAACQFYVGPVGPVYGAQSTDLDLDLIQPDAFARWTGQAAPTPEDDDVGQQFALWNLGGKTYAVASNLQTRWAIPPQSVNEAQFFLSSIPGANAGVNNPPNADFAALLTGVPDITGLTWSAIVAGVAAIQKAQADDATAASVSALSAHVDQLTKNVGAPAQAQAVETHLLAQDGTLGAIKAKTDTIGTGSGSGGASDAEVEAILNRTRLTVEPPA